MRVAIASPLFPPDTAFQARYVKELATRLAQEHDVEVIVYGRYPENAARASFVCVDKRNMLPVRIARFARALYSCARSANVLILENGPSVELPFLLVRPFVRTRTILHIGDEEAYARKDRSYARRLLSFLVGSTASTVVESRPRARPEILPLDPYPEEQLARYETSWTSHLQELATQFHE